MSAPQRQTDSLTAAQSQSAEAFYTSLKNAAKTLDVQLTRDQKQPELADVLMCKLRVLLHRTTFEIRICSNELIFA